MKKPHLIIDVKAMDLHSGRIVPKTLTGEEAEELRRKWNQMHRGLGARSHAIALAQAAAAAGIRRVLPSSAYSGAADTASASHSNTLVVLSLVERRPDLSVFGRDLRRHMPPFMRPRTGHALLTAVLVTLTLIVSYI